MKGPFVHTPLQRPVPRHGRRLAAAATIAATAVLGATLGAAPASAGGPPALTAATSSLSTSAGTAVTATHAAVRPVVKLTANYGVVTGAHRVTFTATEKTSHGAAIAHQRAVFYVHTVHGWKKTSTATTSSTGTVRFTFKPTVAHKYLVHFPAVAGKYVAASTKSVIVRIDIGPRIVAAAAKEKGHPYRFGAAGPHAFDCSGLVKFVFHKFGIKLPHKANAMKHYGKKVSRSHAKPGDLVFVMHGSYASHVAIYAGHNTWWEAPHPGAKVRHAKIWTKHVQFRHVR